MNNNYKCKICRDTGKKLQFRDYYKEDYLTITYQYDKVECDCIQITNLTTEEDLNNNLMRIEVKINV